MVIANEKPKKIQCNHRKTSNTKGDKKKEIKEIKNKWDKWEKIAKCQTENQPHQYSD